MPAKNPVLTCRGFICLLSCSKNPYIFFQLSDNVGIFRCNTHLVNAMKLLIDCNASPHFFVFIDLCIVSSEMCRVIQLILSYSSP